MFSWTSASPKLQDTKLFPAPFSALVTNMVCGTWPGCAQEQGAAQKLETLVEQLSALLKMLPLIE